MQGKAKWGARGRARAVHADEGGAGHGAWVGRGRAGWNRTEQSRGERMGQGSVYMQYRAGEAGLGRLRQGRVGQGRESGVACGRDGRAGWGEEGQGETEQSRIDGGRTEQGGVGQGRVGLGCVQHSTEQGGPVWGRVGQGRQGQRGWDRGWAKEDRARRVGQTRAIHHDKIFAVLARRDQRGPSKVVT